MIIYYHVMAVAVAVEELVTVAVALVVEESVATTVAVAGGCDCCLL